MTPHLCEPANEKIFEQYEIIKKSHENTINIIKYYFLYVFYIDSRHYEIMLCDIKIDIVFTGEWYSLGVRFNYGNTT